MMEGLRYLQGRPRLLATVLVKGGLGLMIGATWVIYTILGERHFAVHLPGSAGQRGAVLGMSLLIGARGIGALLGPLLGRRTGPASAIPACAAEFCWDFWPPPAVWARSPSRPPSGWRCCRVIVAHFGGSIIWTFSTTLLQLNTDDQYPRARVLRRPRHLHGHHLADRLGGFDRD